MLMQPLHRKKLERALTRRYGESILPLKVTSWGERDPQCYRVEDLETGAFIVARFKAGRLRVIGEGGRKNESGASVRDPLAGDGMD